MVKKIFKHLILPLTVNLLLDMPSIHDSYSPLNGIRIPFNGLLFILYAGEKRRWTERGYGTRRLPAEPSSLRGECSVDSSLFYAMLSMVRQRAYPRSFGSPVSLVTTWTTNSSS